MVFTGEEDIYVEDGTPRSNTGIGPEERFWNHFLRVLRDVGYLNSKGIIFAGLCAMWTWSLNWGQITADIVIGTCPMTPGDLRRIHTETGVAGVLSLQHDDCLAYWGIDYAVMKCTGTELGLVMQRCPIRDFDVPDMRRRLPAATSMLAKMIAHGRRVYVHCTAGLGRSPLVVLGYLALVEGYLPEKAHRLILKGRPGAVPSWEAFYGCCSDLTARYRQAIEQRAYELYTLGVHVNADTDWFQAQAEILRSVLT